MLIQRPGASENWGETRGGVEGIVGVVLCVFRLTKFNFAGVRNFAKGETVGTVAESLELRGPPR